MTGEQTNRQRHGPGEPDRAADRKTGQGRLTRRPADDTGARGPAARPEQALRPRGDGRTEQQPDVLLDVPVLKVDEINLEVDDLQARVSLQAEVLDLLKLHVGADVSLGRVSIGIKGVEAAALLKVRLDNVSAILDRVMTTIDENPQILGDLSRGLGEAVGEVGRGSGEALREVGQGAGGAVEQVGQGAGGAVEQVGQGAGGAVDQVGEGAGSAAESVSDEVSESAGQLGRGAGRGAGSLRGDAGDGTGDADQQAGEAKRPRPRNTGNTGRPARQRPRPAPGRRG